MHSRENNREERGEVSDENSEGLRGVNVWDYLSCHSYFAWAHTSMGQAVELCPYNQPFAMFIEYTAFWPYALIAFRQALHTLDDAIDGSLHLQPPEILIASVE